MGVNGIYGLSGSGLDVESMVKVGMLSKQKEYEKMQQKYTQNEWKKAEFLDLYGEVQTFNNSTLSQYKMSGNMAARSATSNNTSAVSATANANAPSMSHYVEVGQLASAAYLIGNNHVKGDGQQSVELLDKILGEGYWKYDTETNMILVGNYIKDGELKNLDENNNEIELTKLAGNTDTAFHIILSDGTVDPNLKTNAIQSSNNRVVQIDNLNREDDELAVGTHTVVVSTIATHPTITMGSTDSGLTSNTSVSEWFFDAMKNNGVSTDTLNANLLSKYVTHLKDANGSGYASSTALSFSFTLNYTDAEGTGHAETKNLNFSYTDLLNTNTDTNSFVKTLQSKLDHATNGFGAGKVIASVDNGQLVFTASDTGSTTSINFALDYSSFAIGNTDQLKSYPETMSSTQISDIDRNTNALDFFSKIFATNNTTASSTVKKSAITTLVRERDLDSEAFSFQISSGEGNTATISIKYGDLTDSTEDDHKILEILKSPLESIGLKADIRNNRLYISSNNAGEDAKISFKIVSSDFTMGNSLAAQAPENLTSLKSSDSLSAGSSIGELMYQVFGFESVDQYNKYMPSLKNTAAEFTFKVSDGSTTDTVTLSADFLSNTSKTMTDLASEINRQLSGKVSFHISYGSGNSYAYFQNETTGSDQKIQFEVSKNFNFPTTSIPLGTYTTGISTTSNAELLTSKNIKTKTFFKQLFNVSDVDYQKALENLRDNNPPSNKNAFALTFSNSDSADGGTIRTETVVFTYSDLADDNNADSGQLFNKLSALEGSIGVKVAYENNQFIFSSTKVGTTLKYTVSEFAMGSGTAVLGTAPSEITMAVATNDISINQWFANLTGIQASDIETYVNNIKEAGVDITEAAFTLKFDDGDPATTSDANGIKFSYADLMNTNTSSLKTLIDGATLGNIHAKLENQTITFSNTKIGNSDKLSYTIEYNENLGTGNYIFGTPASSQGTSVFNGNAWGTNAASLFSTSLNGVSITDTYTSTTTTNTGKDYEDEYGQDIYQYTIPNGTILQTTAQNLTKTAKMVTTMTDATLDGQKLYTIEGRDFTSNEVTGTPQTTATIVQATDGDNNPIYTYTLLTDVVTTTDASVVQGTPLYAVTFDGKTTYQTTTEVSSSTNVVTNENGTTTTYVFEIGGKRYETTNSSLKPSVNNTATLWRYNGNIEIAESSITPVAKMIDSSTYITDTSGLVLYEFIAVDKPPLRIYDYDGKISTDKPKQIETTTQLMESGNPVWTYSDGKNISFDSTDPNISLATTKLYVSETTITKSGDIPKSEYLKQWSESAVAFSFTINDGVNYGTEVEVKYGHLMNAESMTSLMQTISDTLPTNIVATFEDGVMKLQNKKIGGSANQINIQLDLKESTYGMNSTELATVTQGMFGVAITGDTTTSIITTNASEKITASNFKTAINNFWTPSGFTVSTNSDGGKTIGADNTGQTSGETAGTLRAKLENFFGITTTGGYKTSVTPGEEYTGLTSSTIAQNVIKFFTGNSYDTEDATYSSKIKSGSSDLQQASMARQLAQKLTPDRDSTRYKANNGTYTYTADGGYNGPSNTDIGDALLSYFKLNDTTGDYYQNNTTVSGKKATFKIDGTSYESNTNIYIKDENGASVKYEIVNPGEAVSVYQNEEIINLTYEKLMNGYTFNDLAVDINSLGTNIRSSYDSVQDRFSIYNKQSGSANQIRLTTMDENSAQFFKSLDLFQSVEGERQSNALDASDLSKWYPNFKARQTSILAGTDAIAKIDGVDYVGLDANSVTVNGVSYTFNMTTHNTVTNEKGEKVVDSSSAKEGMSKVAVSVTQDSAKIAENVKSFVEKYNTLINKLYEWYNEKPNSDYKPLTEAQKSSMKEEQIEKWEEKAKAGLLYHDKTLGNLITEIRRVVTEKVEGVSGKYNNIFALGISTTGIKGNLTVDEAKLSEAIAADPDAVYNIFARLDGGESYTQVRLNNGSTVWRKTDSLTNATDIAEIYRDKTKTVERSSYNGIAQRLGDILTSGMKSLKSVSGSTADVTEDSDLNNLLRELQTKMSNFQRMMKAFETKLYKKYDAMESSLALLGAQLNYVTGAFSQ